jgi:hypothetical protein
MPVMPTRARTAISTFRESRTFWPCTSREDQGFWPGLSLDLSRATLVDLEFGGATVDTADFTGARFSGVTQFADATFFRQGMVRHGNIQRRRLVPRRDILQ